MFENEMTSASLVHASFTIDEDYALGDWLDYFGSPRETVAMEVPARHAEIESLGNGDTVACAGWLPASA